MLSSKFKVFTSHDGMGNHVIVVRLLDMAQKYFFLAGGNNKKGIESFMASMTDELFDTYFPKAGKKGGSNVDNWAFLGHNPGRKTLEELVHNTAK